MFFVGTAIPYTIPREPIRSAARLIICASRIIGATLEPNKEVRTKLNEGDSFKNSNTSEDLE